MELRAYTRPIPMMGKRIDECLRDFFALNRERKRERFLFFC